MRDKAVASQDQDPTTEPAPAGEAPAGKDAGPSDASETIVSGSHAAGTSARPADTAPAEHESWEAEFAGLAGSNAADSASPSDAAAAGAAPADAAAGGDADVNAPGDADTAGSAAVAETTDSAARTVSGPPEAPLDRRAASAKAAAERNEVPGGHPSVAQRSTLPMRAASTMPNLNRRSDSAADTSQDTAASQGTDTDHDADTSPDAGTVPDAGAGRDQDAGTHGAGAENTDTDRGPWYVSKAEHPGTAPGTDPVTDTGSEPGPDADAIQDEEAQRRSLERERAAAAKPVLARVVQVMIAVFFPVMLLAAAIRAVATPMFLWVEYYRPGFPADSFGFSAEDRMTYGSYAVDYLLNFASPRYLGDLVTPDGDPLYLASEVSHMADVKMVLGIAFLSALGMALLSIAGGIYLARRCPGGIRRALFAGAVATLALIVVLLVAAVLAWEQFFTQVHSIFFSQGNWTFRLDDTLIRLFPSQFWMDSAGTVAGLVLLASLLVLIFTWPTKRRRERSRLAREAARRRYLESLESV